MIGAIILGLLAGYIAKALMPGKDPGGFFVTILLGLAGSLIGFFLFTELLGIGDDQAFDLGGLIGAIIGTMILLGVYRAVVGSGEGPERPGYAADLVCTLARVSAPAFDLQSHSLHSDGELSAAQVVENAAAAGVKLLALSDHDTVDGRRRGAGVRARCTACAWSPPPRSRRSTAPTRTCTCSATGSTTAAGLLGERLLDARADRERRADAMAARLRELGFEIDPAPIEARKAAGKPVGRPHLAAAVLAHPANAERLAAEGHADVSSFIPAYLIQGNAGYVARTHPTVEEAIGWIHEAAGVAVWAHPFWDIEDDGAGAGGDRPLPRGRAWTASRSSTRPIPSSRRCCWPTAAPSWTCSRPARPTTTAPTTGCSARSARSTCQGASPTSARSPTARSPRRRAGWTGCACG